MPYYVAPYCPEELLEVKPQAQRDARFEAAFKLASLINEGHLSIKLPNGFSTRRLIEIKREDLVSKQEEEIIQAVKILCKLSYAKQKVQSLFEQSQKAHKNISVLFENETLTPEEFEEIRQSLKIFESFARANSSYKEALLEAEFARSILDKSLEIL